MEVSALQLRADSSGIRDATVALKEIPPAATAAERAAQRWGVATTAAGRTTEDFSRRVQGVIRQLDFERAQLTRTAAEQAKYNALRRAGVTEASAEGRAIMASVAALQAQRAAIERASAASNASGSASTGVLASGVLAVTRSLAPLAAGFTAVAAAQKIWQSGMVIGDLGEQAEQLGLSTDHLQAYRFAAEGAGVSAEQLDAGLMRLTKAMGEANSGNAEMIQKFSMLGVKLLDVEGNMRGPADILPELSRGLLALSSNTERNALLMDLMGRSGARMVTMLGEWAKGNEAVVGSAKRMGAVAGPDVIKAWDDLGDAIKTADRLLTVFLATAGAPIATGALSAFNDMLKSTNREIELIVKGYNMIRDFAGVSLKGMETEAAQVQARIDKLHAQPQTTGNQALMQREYARLGMLQQKIADGMTAAYMPTITVTADKPPGGNPGAKGGGSKSDPYAKAIESAREYIATKKAEIAAVGLTAEAAARLKHQQELVNKASSDNTKLSAAQRAELTGLANDMAQVDSALASSTFMNDANKNASKFIGEQQFGASTIGMSPETVAAMRFEQEMLNAATAAGITLTAAQSAEISGLARGMASAEARTRNLGEAFEFAKSTFSGFLTDMVSSLQQGQGLWESFGNAAMNVLDKVANKLLEMAIGGLINMLFSAVTGGLGGGGGIGGLIAGGMLSGTGGIYAKGGAFDHGRELAFANGAAFNRGSVVRFAGGGIVTSPTTFGMSGGRTGLMGEAGPEGILPLHRGPDGGLGVRASGLNKGGATNGRIDIHVHENGDLLRLEIDNRSNANIVRAAPKIEDRAVKRANAAVPSIMAKDHHERGGDYRV